MRTPQNRAARRQMRACVRTAAAVLARCCIDRNPRTGRHVTVSAPRAVQALERAFALLLTEGGKPQVLRLTDEAAAAFPAHDPAIIPPGARPFIAVGLDVDGRATFTLRHIVVGNAADATTERRAAEALMRAELAPSLARSGWGDKEARA